MLVFGIPHPTRSHTNNLRITVINTITQVRICMYFHILLRVGVRFVVIYAYSLNQNN